MVLETASDAERISTTVRRDRRTVNRELSTYRGAELRSRCAAAEIRRAHELQRFLDGGGEPLCLREETEPVLEQERGRAQHRRRVRDSLTGDVRRRAVHRLEDPWAAVGERRG